MRVIKFRGKNEALGWLHGNLCYGRVFDKVLIQVIESNYLSWCVEPETVGEFTGLKDKNGNEIYEGDILNREKSGFELSYVVVWDEKEAQFRGERKGTMVWLSPLFFGSTSIIGNIYDNHELLKGV